MGRRTTAAAGLLALALAGCGGSTDTSTSTVAQQSAKTTTGGEPSAGSTTATSTTKSHSKEHATTKKQSAAAKSAPATAQKLPPSVKRAKRYARNQQRAFLQLARVCRQVKPASLPHLPQDSASMPKYARSVLPAARLNTRDLGAAQNRYTRRQLTSLYSAYQNLVPLLEQLSRRDVSKEESKALARPTVTLVMALSRAAHGIGLERCALPV